MFKKMKEMFGKESKEITILSPMEGSVVPADQINDPTFKEQLLGPTIGIKPAGNRVVAPLSGSINSIFETGHALTIISDSGVELIIHIGLDTVQLKGRFFKIHAKDGDKIKPGDLLVEFDKDEIIKAGYDVITPIIICNAAMFSDIEMFTGKDAKEQDEIIRLKK